MKHLIILLVIVANSLSASASHIVGGEIYYDYLGNDNYRFYISMYRDCNSTGAQFDSPLHLAVYNNGSLINNIDVPFPGSAIVPVVFNNPCVTPPNNICTENALYTTVINLPAAVGGYTVSFQRCCRGPSISNINNPDDTGFTLTCRVPGINTGASANSSPRFNDYPPQLLCNNEDLVFDHSALDPDGDQLVYSLVTPFSGGSPMDVAPNPAAAPGYIPVQWLGGFSAANPLGPGATISIDPNTGLLTASPNLLGQFVVGIQVQEIRGGIVINETTRDFLFRVFNCVVQLESILPLQTDLPDFVSYCQGYTINFVNNSYGGTNYEWDFGVPGTNTDVSSAFEPSFTYPGDGTYTAMLVVNPGWPCTDTAYMEIIVNNELQVTWDSNDSLCIFGNSFDFVATSTGTATTIYTWDFGANATAPSTTGINVNGVNFSSGGYHPVTVTAVDDLCTGEFIDSIFIFPEPIAEIILPANIECDGFSIDFGNNSQNAITYDWDFGVVGSATDISSAFDPTFLYPGPGTYTVTLTASSSPVCSATTTETITLNEPLVVSFTSEDSLCLTTNNFNFDGTVSGPPGSVFTWTFGPNASISTSNDIDVPNVVFDTTGAIPITLSGAFENCFESVTQLIYIFAPPEIDFAIEPGLQCAPFNAQFIDLSTSETTLYYNWNFGDGSSSTLQNPSHLYNNVGNYPVTLSIHTLQGCVDTLTLTQDDLVNVRPRPTAGFSVTPDYTDICHSSIAFIDESIDADDWFYWYDDGNFFSKGIQSPFHTYVTPGSHYPRQIVTNEYGCKDTATSYLFIEPFTIYAPNTFTPDGDNFNNVFLPIVYLTVERWELQIFNRWGELVFETDDVDEPWDGVTQSGAMAQDGTYIWKLVYVSCEPLNPEQVATGHVTLVR